MNNSEKLTLIKGEFKYQEAKEILINLFLAKIHFHEMKNFSSQERFGKDDDISAKRLPELKTEMKKLEEILNEAKATKHHLMVCSELSITFSKE
jgi:hypothetical protein